MLICRKCGWQGVNLVPKPETNEAVCPKCGTVFQGILAKNAITVSPAEEQDIIKEAEKLRQFAAVLFPGK
jgi:transcription initiation factor TFIIIB Brf1 subunit/transcription initiation factor TFIIB